MCAYFSPDDEIEPFESQVIAPLVVALAPAQSSDDGDASESPSSAGAVPANGPHDTTTSAAVQRSVQLQSEVIDSTSMWRVYLRAIDSYVCCTVVFRCALQPDNTLWIVGSYVPCQAPDGSWITNERLGSTKCADQAWAMPAECREPSKSRDQARAARIMVVDPAGSPPGSCEAAPLAPSSTEDNSELEEQLDLMSANELLNLL